MREGSARGGRRVEVEFAQAITRRRLCRLVGIHPSTLRRWENIGVIAPKMKPIMGTITAVFIDEDVEFARALAKTLQANPGQLSVPEAARLIRSSRGS